jgi:hypothetical protein
MMEETGRPLDTRDSSVISKIYNTSRGKSSASPKSQLSRQHVTPWGTPVGVRNKEEEAANAAAGVPSISDDEKMRTLTRAANHFQNDERQTTTLEGLYTVPDVTETHNHFQNSETDQVDERLKLASSKINDGVMEFGSPNKEEIPEAKLKMAPLTSRINAGNDIFGDPLSSFKSPPPPRIEPFVDPPVATGHIKTRWPGYTDAAQRF